MDITEVFYSIQGEGPWIGRPAIFVRTAGCNLHCGFCLAPNTTISTVHDRQLPIKDVSVGDDVLSWDGQKVVADTVMAVYQHTVQRTDMVRIECENDAGYSKLIYCTADHPFITNTGIVPAGQLMGHEVLHITARDARSWKMLGERNAIHKADEETRKRMNEASSKRWKGVPVDQVTRDKISATRRANPTQNFGAKNGNWKGGPKWQYTSMPVQLRDDILVRDNHICQICGQEGNIVHHIDYDPNHNSMSNLCVLCRNCNSGVSAGNRTYRGRNDWEQVLVRNGVMIRNVRTPRWDEIIRMGLGHRGSGGNPDTVEVFNLETRHHHNFFANNLLVHNCDTKYSWNTESRNISIDSLMESMSWLECKTVVITGGEPTIQMGELIKLIERLKRAYYDIGIETNATNSLRRIQPYLRDEDIIVMSPKYIDGQYRLHEDNNNDYTGTFKIVAEHEEQVKAIREQIHAHNENIWLMPQCTSRKEYIGKAQQVIDWCKLYGYNFSPREHLVIWDIKKGV